MEWKGALLTDCDSDGSDMEYYLPSRLLNAYAEPMQRDYEKNNIISDDELLLTIPSLPSIPLLSTANNKQPKASTPKRVQSEELTASTSHGNQTVKPKLQVVKNKDGTLNGKTEKPATAEYSPKDVFLPMYPPTSRSQMKCSTSTAPRPRASNRN